MGLNGYGRKIIYTGVEAVTRDNILEVLGKAMPKHLENAAQIDFLLNDEKGEQPLKRVKKVRSDIDIRTVDNLANEITQFKIGFQWGNPITLIQRGKEDSGSKNEKEPEAIALLNECFESENYRSKRKELARFVEIGAVGYTYIGEKTDYEEGDSYFQYECLDPRFTFVVRSSRYIDHRIMLAVSYSKDSDGNLHFSCFTDGARFEIENLTRIADASGRDFSKDDKGKIWVLDKEFYGSKYLPIGIPIVEWIRDYDRMGCFERQIPEMDALNIAESDIVNQQDQETQAIWHANDVDFPKVVVKDENGNTEEKVIHPESNDWVQTYTSHDGKTPFIKPLTVPTDYTGLLSNVVTRRRLILEKCNVPMRNDSTGGATGVAMSDATGWTQAEAVAIAQQNIMEQCVLQEVRIALKVIKLMEKTPKDSPLMKLRASDVKPNIARNRSYELTVKSNALATLLSHGIDGLTAIKTVQLFEDPLQTYCDSKGLIEKYQKSVFDKEEPAPSAPVNSSDDPANQVNNSPVIDGNKKEEITDSQETKRDDRNAEKESE